MADEEQKGSAQFDFGREIQSWLDEIDVPGAAHIGQGMAQLADAIAEAQGVRESLRALIQERYTDRDSVRRSQSLAHDILFKLQTLRGLLDRYTPDWESEVASRLLRL